MLEYIKVLGASVVLATIIRYIIYPLWIQPRIENKKDKREQRKKLLKELRFDIENNQFKNSSFLLSLNYNLISSELKKDFKVEIEGFIENNNNEKAYIIIERSDDYYVERDKLKVKFLNELNRIEKKWKLNL